MSCINKNLREKVYNKYGGLCAYSGTPLEADWQIDHLKPIIRVGPGEMFKNDNYDNLMPCQKIINHYKRAHDLELFRRLLMTLHKRIGKPKNPRTEKSKKKKEYLNKIASYFKITPDKPFSGVFYFERVGKY